VRLSAFSVVDSFPPEVAGSRDRYAEVLDLAESCDRAGLSAFWVAEHHFQPGGLCPSPPVLLAAAAQRTRRIRLGVLVSVLPFHSAIEVAEQYALLDQLVGGRLNFGVGSGYIAVEFEGFGVDPASKRERFDRALETVLRAWRGERVRGDGAGARAIQLNVVPRQQPHPPLWIAVQRREALPFVARRGASVALVPYATVQDLAELKSEVDEFRAALPAGVSASVSAALHLYAGSEPELARAALQRYLESRLATQSTFYQQKVQRDPGHASAEALEAAGFALFGTAAEVSEKLEGYRAAGVDEVLGIFDFGGLALDEVRASVAALGSTFSP
jgi:alkanesulfonate monooxygenase SsuD/methylene tetrahydromethanopterin reductase-like flavin-dependent oxidoreductase (luciferase family)